MSRILVVDDDDAIRALVTRLLTNYGHDVTTASDGEEAVERIHDGEFDAVVLDLMMPRLDGIGVLDRMHEMGSRVPVVLITAAAPSLLNQIPVDRVHSVLTKPFELTDLMSRVDGALNPAASAGVTPMQVEN